MNLVRPSHRVLFFGITLVVVGGGIVFAGRREEAGLESKLAREAPDRARAWARAIKLDVHAVSCVVVHSEKAVCDVVLRTPDQAFTTRKLLCDQKWCAREVAR